MVAFMPSEHERETAFLRRCIRYDKSPSCRDLDERIVQVQRDERCLRRAMTLVALTAALAVAGLMYGAVFLEDFPGRMQLFTSQFTIRSLLAVGIGSVISLVAFTGTSVVYRKNLNRRREECRTLVTKLLESHLGEPRVARRSSGFKEDRESGSSPAIPAS
jgi:hypothetical protein